MYKFGLKLWSTNTDNYFEEAKRLYEEGVFRYIELYVVPDTIDTLTKWKKLDIPFNIHCPHFMHGFNLADADKIKFNADVYKQVKLFADELNANYIVFHGGVDGNVEETAKQLKAFQEPRAVLENKPFRAIPNKMNGTFCRGATLEEIKYVLKEAECGFCLDIGHAICAANSQGIDKWKFIKELNRLKPIVYHLTDLKDVNSEYDSHVHIGYGTVDVKHALSYIEDNSMITIETEKNTVDLSDFEGDVVCLDV